MISWLKGRLAIYLAACLLILFTGTATYQLFEHNRDDGVTSVELTRSFLNIERSIGYAGLIHHFKNHVLRPQSPLYSEQAKQSYQVAIKELANLQSIMNHADIQVEVSELQDTLKLYYDAIEQVSKAHLSGIAVTEIDRQFRVPDNRASIILVNLQKQIEHLLKDRRQSSVKLRWLSLMVFMGASISLIASLAHTWFELQRLKRREYELQQLELNTSIQHSVEMAKLVQELERSNRELDDFAYTASHDLKEPMRGIAINANLLAREKLSEDGHRRIERINLLTTRLDQLVSDILFFSRLGRGDQRKEDIDPSVVIEGIKTELIEWLQERGGEITVTGILPYIHAERSKVKTVFQNLIVNGLKYNDAERKIVEIGFQSKIEAGGATLRNVYYVSDNGIGIDSSNHDKIFRIFSRLNLEEDYGPGTGAGLSFVRKIIENYNGKITLATQPGKGTTFYFSLPGVESVN